MPNPSINRSSKQLHEISESVQERIDQTIPELRSRVKGIATETAEQLTEVSHKAKGWIQENYGKTLGVVGAITAVGVLGYLIGRNNTTSEIWSAAHENSEKL